MKASVNSRIGRQAPPPMLKGMFRVAVMFSLLTATLAASDCEILFDNLLTAERTTCCATYPTTSVEITCVNGRVTGLLA